jgi:hypothetical protein
VRPLPRWLSVALVAGVGLAAFVSAVFPPDDGDSLERGAPRPSFTTPPREEETTFNANGYSFAYPASWTKGRERMTEAGRATTAFGWDAPTAVSPSTSGEALVLVAEPLQGPLTRRDLDPYLGLMGKRLESEGERPLQAPTRVTVAGFPALRGAVEFPDGAVRRYTVILARRTAYFLTCTFISEEMRRGCDRVEDSFAVE